MTHPTPEALASFVDGTADATTRAEVAGHIEGCDDCLMAVGETARLLEEEESDSRRGWGIRRWPFLAAAAAAIIFTSGWLMHERSLDPVDRLAEASRMLKTRGVEGRLEGFDHRQFSPQRGGGETRTEADANVTIVATEIRERCTAAQHDAMKQHAAGVAALVSGDPVPAAEMLKRAIDLSPRTARYWNDYAVALIARKQFPAALEATSHAIALEPRSPVALFNRAVVLDAMGQPDNAVAAYRAYLARDSTSAWADEAAVHRERLVREREREAGTSGKRERR